MKKLYLIPLILVGCRQPDYFPVVDATANDVQEEVIDAGTDSHIEDAHDADVADAESLHQNILLIGDSQVLYANWFFKPLKKSNETVFFDSKPGTTIGWWNYGTFHKEMSNYTNLDVVIIFLGTNNFNFTFLQPYQNILDEIRKRHVKCIWVGPTEVYGKKHIINQLIKTAVSNDCTYVNTEELSIPLADGVHPTAEGTVKWLTEIWKIKDHG